ncbi:hypothetical protein [Fictibacillus sp. NRS-1165]|uniref:hypothetical protein n=1 Tax=Fictibacillus sp. NRS-1165 TaxID=3144463 RepID=UPI003D1CB779
MSKNKKSEKIVFQNDYNSRLGCDVNLKNVIILRINKKIFEAIHLLLAPSHNGKGIDVDESIKNSGHAA